LAAIANFIVKKFENNNKESTKETRNHLYLLTHVGTIKEIKDLII
jgi:hypothetical protein